MSPDPDACRRLVVLRGGALGDGIVTLPALAAIRARWPRAQVCLFAYPHLGRLALAGGLVDETRSLDDAAMASLFTARGPLASPLAAWLDGVDLAVNYLADPDGRVAARLQAAGVAQVLSVAPRGPWPGHAADALALPLRALGVPVRAPCIPGLRLKANRNADTDRGIAAGYFTLHPGSGSPTKNWPLALYVALARRLAQDTGLQPVFVLGEAEVALGPALAAAGMPAPPIRSDVLATAALLSPSRVHVGNDSGISHLAAALGVPVVALFGPSDPGQWAPRGPWVRVLRSEPPTAEGLAAMGVDRVAAATGGLLVEVRGVEPLTS